MKDMRFLAPRSQVALGNAFVGEALLRPSTSWGSKSILLPLLLFVATCAVHGDGLASNTGSTIESPEQTAARELRVATCPISECPQTLLDKQYGGITLGNIRPTKPFFVYVWKGLTIDPKSIPNLNVFTQLNQIYPISMPYREWADLRYTYIAPPPFQYLSDDETGEFMKGYLYRNGWVSIFFRAGSDLYKKSDLPAGVQTLIMKNLKVIPLASY